VDDSEPIRLTSGVVYSSIVQVEGRHLEREPPLVRNLRQLECSDHTELADVYLIVSEDGSIQMPNFGIHCCDKFRAAAKATIDAHNEAVRRR
jgi:hypothetical protein